jgi:predicted PurR-regulated permease PerM
MPPEPLPAASPAEQSESQHHETAENRLLRRVAMLLGIIVVSIFLTFGYFASSLFLTLILSGFFAILLDPLVEILERWHLPRTIGAVLVLSVAVGILGLGAAFAYGKAANVAEDLPVYTRKLQSVLRPVIDKIQRVEDTAGKINNPIPRQKREPEVTLQQKPQWPTYIARGVSSVWGALVIAGVVPVLVFFMLVRKRQTYARFESWLGRYIDFPTFVRKLNVMIRAFVGGNLIIGAVVAACLIAVLAALHLEGAVIIGLVSGFLNLIPYLGLVLAVALPLLAGAVQFNSVGPFLVIALTVVVLHLIANNIAVPRFIGSRVDIGPVAATIGILFWGWLWGAVGLLLAVPLTAFIKLMAEAHPAFSKVAEFLSESARPIPSWAQPGAAPWARVHAYVRESMHRRPGEGRHEAE